MSRENKPDAPIEKDELKVFFNNKLLDSVETIQVNNCNVLVSIDRKKVFIETNNYLKEIV